MAISIDTAKIKHGAVGTLTLGGTDLGPTTRDGVTIKSDQTYGTFYVDQQLTPVVNALKERKYSVDCVLAHSHLTNLLVALNLNSSTSLNGSSLSLNSSESPLAQLVIVAPCPGAGNRTYIFDSARVTSNLSITHKSDIEQPALLPITFECLYSSTTGRTGIVGDA
jgi:hypothetical protein